MNSGFDINDLVQEAQNRWLKPAEVLFILQNHENYHLTDVPLQKPSSGSLFLFNKRVTRFFRRDGHNWRKKKAGRTVREGHERLKVGNVEALNCYYAHGEQDFNFQRRSFWMLDPAYEHIVLVHYRDISERKNSAGSRLSPNGSSVLSTSHYTADNRGSISAISEPCQSSFSPESTELTSELLFQNNGLNYMGETSRTGKLYSSPAANVNQALRRLEDPSSLNGNKLPDVSPYFEENDRPKDSIIPIFLRRSNQDKLVAQHYTSDYKESHQCSGGTAGISNASNNSMFLSDPGGYKTESLEVPPWNVLLEQCPGSCWIDPQDEVFDTLDQLEKSVSLSEGADISTNLGEQQEKWTSQWLDHSGPGINTENMNNCQPTFQNKFEPQASEARQFSLDFDNLVSPTTTSLLQEAEYSKLSAHFSGPSTHEGLSNCYFDPMSQLEAAVGLDSRLTLALNQRFRIQAISPEWGYAIENTKVFIVGSFLCNPSDCNWSCMFGEIEVPVQIIQEGVLCCQAPPHIPGKVTLCITSTNRESCSEVREFEYCSKPSICDYCSPAHSEELLLLVRLVQMLLVDPLVVEENSVNSVVNLLELPRADDPWEHLIGAVLDGSGTQLKTKDWLLQELLKDKLQHWLSSRYKEGDPSGCSLTKKEQGILHLVSGLGFEWALNPTLKCGVCVNYRDINGWTALHWAARFGREKMVAALIAAGASAGALTDPTPQDPVGKTAGSIAASSGHKGLAGYLSEVALTSHLSSLTIEESEISKESAEVEVQKYVESISNVTANTTDDQLSLKDSLAAVRNSTQAAARIQSYFRILSYKRRQQREAAAACCDEYGITPDELAAASKLALSRFHDHILDEAALSIQKKYRGWKGRQEFVALRQKIVMIQAHVRGYQVRKRYKVIIWAVGILDKVVLRWYRKRVGLRGLQLDSDSVDDSGYEDVLKAFRKLKVDHAIEEALSRVLSMVESPEARQQYRRMLESYWQAKND